MKWLLIVVLIIMLMCFGQTATACSDHSGGSQSGGQSSDTGVGSESGGGGGASGGGPGAGGGGAGGSGSGQSGTSTGNSGDTGDSNGPAENPCQYYWNWGSAKLKCKPPFGE